MPDDDDDTSQEGRDLEGDEENDSELDDYYQELGIEPTEMPKEKKVKEEAIYKQKKKEAKELKADKAKRAKSEVLETLMSKARDTPSVKTLSRVIQVVKSVFID